MDNMSHWNTGTPRWSLLRIVKGLSAGTAYVISILSVSCGHRNGEAPEAIILGFEQPGVRLFLKTKERSREPGYKELILDARGTSTRIQDLSALTNHVHIDSREAALRFVRLRTWLYVPGWTQPLEAEIISSEDLHNLPDYGVESYRYALKALSQRTTTSGLSGVLAPEEYRGSHFQKPTVTEVKQGFEIKRWLLVNAGSSNSAVLVDELVGSTGSYEQHTIKEVPLPKLADTYWGFPKAM